MRRLLTEVLRHISRDEIDAALIKLAHAGEANAQAAVLFSDVRRWMVEAKVGVD